MRRTFKRVANGLLVIGIVAGFLWLGNVIFTFEGFGYRTETYETKKNLKGFAIPDFLKRGDKLSE